MKNQTETESFSLILEVQKVETLQAIHTIKSCCGDCKNNGSCTSSQVKEIQALPTIDTKHSK